MNILRTLNLKLTTFLSFILLLACLETAGLDSDVILDSVLAVYQFENVTDRGPRGFDGRFYENASIVNGGKFGKCLRLRNQDWFGMSSDAQFSIIDEFSIVAWVKLSPQNHSLRFVMSGINNDVTSAGNILLSIEPSGNIKGQQFDAEDNKFALIGSDGKNVSDDRWHHVAFTKYKATYALFIDGEISRRVHAIEDLGFVGDNTFIYVAGKLGENLIDSVFVDETAFFKTGLSVNEIAMIYNDGLSDFLEAMPVNSQEKVAMTWGEIKHTR